VSRPTLTAVLGDAEGWTLAIAHDDPALAPPRGGALGELVAAAAARGVSTTGPVVLGLPAVGVYAASLPTAPGLAAGLRRDRDHALAFALEEKLPVDLEDVVTAFGPVVQPGDASAVRLGLAAEIRPLRERLTAARAAGLRVTAAVPTALLVAASDTAPAGSDETAAAVWLTEAGLAECYSEVQHVAGTPHAWRLHPEPPAAPSAPLTPDAAVAAAARAAPGRVVCFNLARGALRPAGASAAQGRPWAALAAALGLLLGSAGVCGLLDARAHRVAAAADTAATVDAYRAAFPGTDVPVDLLGRLRSAARAAALEGPADAGPASPVRTDTLADLTALAAQWPPDPSGLRLDALSLGPDGVTVGGETDEPAALDALTDALAAAGRPALAPPATQLLPRGRTRFELRLAATDSEDGAAP